MVFVVVGLSSVAIVSFCSCYDWYALRGVCVLFSLFGDVLVFFVVIVLYGVWWLWNKHVFVFYDCYDLFGLTLCVLFVGQLKSVCVL